MTRAQENVAEASAGTTEGVTPRDAASHVEEALRLLDGRWKMMIVFVLYAHSVRRFSELERAIAGVSQKMLAEQLREMERDGLVTRTVHAQVPPRVEYRLTEVGEALHPALRALCDWVTFRRVRGGVDARQRTPD